MSTHNTLKQLSEFLKGRPALTLYYKVFDDDALSISNSSVIDFREYIGGDNPYSGTQARFMTDKTYQIYNKDEILFIGYRIPSKELKKNVIMPSTYYETAIILKPDGSQVVAAALYEDSGTTFVTEKKKPLTRFAISSATGVFEGFLCMEIITDNVKKTRIVNFYTKSCGSL